MGWMETCAVDERMRFVIAVEKQEDRFRRCACDSKLSRKTGYKWFVARRRRARDFAGAAPRSDQTICSRSCGSP